MSLYLKVPIEVPLLFLLFAYTIGDSIMPNWLMYQTCTVTLDISKTNCSLLNSKNRNNFTIVIEEEVQPFITVINTTMTLIQAVFSACISLFIGSWSDRYGRKPVLVLNMGASTISYLILTIISATTNSSPWLVVLSVIPSCFSGGFTVLFASILCYLTDVTTAENRGFRMLICFSTVTIGALLGLSSSSFILKWVGFVNVYLISTISVAIAFVLTLITVPESVLNPETDGKLRNLFKLSLIRETIETTFKEREDNKRLMLIILGMLLNVYLLCTSMGSITYLYLNMCFNWSLERYSLFTSINVIVGVFGSGLGIFILNKKLHFNESILILIALTSASACALTRGLANKDWQIYLAGLIGCFDNMISPMGRTLITKLISPEDYGRVFSFLAVCESIIGPLGYPLYTYVYNRSLPEHAEIYNFVSVGIYSIAIILCVMVIIFQRKYYQFSYQNVNLEPESTS